MKVKKEYGVDIKKGYNSSKPIMDGLKGKPCKINENGEYVCEDSEQEQAYKQQGYKTCMEGSES